MPASAAALGDERAQVVFETSGTFLTQSGNFTSHGKHRGSGVHVALMPDVRTFHQIKDLFAHVGGVIGDPLQ